MCVCFADARGTSLLAFCKADTVLPILCLAAAMAPVPIVDEGASAKGITGSTESSLFPK